MPIMNKVLIAESEPLMREQISQMLQNEQDLDVIAAVGSGAEAISQVKKEAPDLILFDIQLTDMPSDTCIQQMLAEARDARVLLMTSDMEDVNIIGGLLSGATGIFIKGESYKQLLRSVYEMLRGEYLLPIECVAKVLNYIYNDYEKL